MQSIMSVIINMNESKLKRRGKPKLLSDLEQKSQGQGHTGRLQLKRSQGLFQYKVSSLY